MAFAEYPFCCFCLSRSRRSGSDAPLLPPFSCRVPLHFPIHDRLDILLETSGIDSGVRVGSLWQGGVSGVGGWLTCLLG